VHKALSTVLVLALSGTAGLAMYWDMGASGGSGGSELSGVEQPAGKSGHPTTGERPAQPTEVLDWAKLESPVLTRHLQLTNRQKFVKAGEQYFNSDATWLIFQAVPVPAEGQAPDPFYSMYVAKINKDDAGHITGLGEPLLVSPPGSANTCGWFHPKETWRIMFGSTVTRPADDQKSGFQVGTQKYKWMFPQEMEIVTRNVIEIAEDVMPGCPMNDGIREAADAKAPVVMFSHPNYDAEGSYSKDGRFVLYARVRDHKEGERADADLWVYDTVKKTDTALVVADGYDGGPFFSPDGKRICYRSDRELNDLLQLFVADLKFDADGAIVGIENEKQLTEGSSVNWAPYWHPNGKVLVYGSSEVGHMNYEVFAVEVDSAKKIGALGKRRITQANGADVLPVFSSDGKYMVWCSQRGPKIAGEERSSSQIWIAECVPGGFDKPEALFSKP
jgi:TolB protein